MLKYALDKFINWMYKKSGKLIGRPLWRIDIYFFFQGGFLYE